VENSRWFEKKKKESKLYIPKPTEALSLTKTFIMAATKTQKQVNYWQSWASNSI